MKHVLLIDDSEDDRELVMDLLQGVNGGITVSAVGTGAEGLAQIATQAPDCVVIDFRLETESGFDVLDRVKSVMPYCPVIILTGQGSESAAAQSFKSGASDYLSKSHLTGGALRRAIENAMRRAELESAIAAQDDERKKFLSHLAHDLRAPLRNINNLCELLAEDVRSGESEDLARHIDLMLARTQRANDLIDALESYALVSQESSNEIVCLTDVVHAAKDNLDSVVLQTHARIETAPLPDIRGSKAQLILLFQNLIQNGLKYNDQEEPVIIIRPEVSRPGRILVRVEDNGLGIPKEHWKTVFEPFKRLWSKDRYEGSGLGLSSCQRIVERHGGQIWCTSAMGVGSQFFVDLPEAP
ncbi:MAG: ATP-binding protein [Magnetospiraceae bacterium]